LSVLTRRARESQKVAPVGRQEALRVPVSAVEGLRAVDGVRYMGMTSKRDRVRLVGRREERCIIE
jgi:hypothetical protein